MNIPIKVSSKKGEGSCFSILLPTCDAPTKLKETPQFVPQIVTENKKILIIDDEVSIRESLCELLTQWKCQVLSAESAIDACNSIEKEQFFPDLIIADYRLRENKTGVEAIHCVKNLLNQEQIPAIIISGDTAPSRLKEVALSGFKLLHKPVKPAHLRTLIQQEFVD
jgi:CheY-like chemotaxis protein